VSNNKQHSYGQKGFTLVEIMIALLVFTVIMLGVAGGLIAAIRTNKGNVVRDEALRIAEDELSRLKVERFSTLGISGALTATGGGWTPSQNILSNMRGGQITFVRATQIADLLTVATALKSIEVVVGWNDPGNAGGAPLAPTGMNRQISLSTTIVRSD
jgi:type IV pilus assembly protein PilV